MYALFGHGKLHSIAKETAKEVNLPFRVMIPLSKQGFLSSSYKQFVQLENRLKVYITTCLVHNNKERNAYKIAGQGFVHELLGIIDLLSAIVLLMLRGKQLACPV